MTLKKDIEYFAEYSGRFNQLDLRLGADLMNIRTGEVGMTMFARQEIRMKKHGKVIRGREMPRLILETYKTSAVADSVHKELDLLAVVMNKEKNLEASRNRWNYVTSGTCATQR